MLKRAAPYLAIALSLGQGLGPRLARAAEARPSGGNPFSRIHLPAQPAPPSNPAEPEPVETATPADRCVDPEDQPPRDFAELVGRYLRSYPQKDVRTLDLAAEVSRWVFEHPGTPEYIERLQYLDAQLTVAPDAIVAIASDLQDQWSARYGMALDEATRARLAQDPGASPPPSVGERRRDRVHIAEDAGAIIGGITAITALSIASVREPQAIPKLYAIFRAMFPAAGFVGGVVAAHESATALNDSGVMERGLPLAPAHVMGLGIDKNDFVPNDETFVTQTLVPMFIGLGAADAFSAAVAGESVTGYLLGAIKAIGLANKAATPAKLEPPVLAASLVISFAVEDLAAQGLKAWQWGDLKNAMWSAARAVQAAKQAGDLKALLRSAETLEATAGNLAAFVYQPVAAAADSNGGSSADSILQRDAEIYDAVLGMDLGADSAYESYAALDALGRMDMETLRALPEAAHDAAGTYAVAFESYLKGYDAWLAAREQTLGESLGESAQEDAYREYFSLYTEQMRAAKDRELAHELLHGEIPKHAGHALLQASALLSATGDARLAPAAHRLFIQALNHQMLIRGVLARGPAPSYGGSPGLY